MRGQPDNHEGLPVLGLHRTHAAGRPGSMLLSSIPRPGSGGLPGSGTSLGADRGPDSARRPPSSWAVAFFGGGGWGFPPPPPHDELPDGDRPIRDVFKVQDAARHTSPSAALAVPIRYERRPLFPDDPPPYPRSNLPRARLPPCTPGGPHELPPWTGQLPGGILDQYLKEIPSTPSSGSG